MLYFNARTIAASLATGGEYCPPHLSIRRRTWVFSQMSQLIKSVKIRYSMHRVVSVLWSRFIWCLLIWQMQTPGKGTPGYFACSSWSPCNLWCWKSGMKTPAPECCDQTTCILDHSLHVWRFCEYFSPLIVWQTLPISLFVTVYL